MPKLEKRVYTYEELAEIMSQRGKKCDTGINWTARLRSCVHVSAEPGRWGLSLRHVSRSGREFSFARAYRVDKGGTLYCVHGLSKTLSARQHSAFRNSVRAFTPHEVSGRVLGDPSWIRIHNGNAVSLPQPATNSAGKPLACWLDVHPITRPSYEMWLTGWKPSHPKLCGRARSLYTRLARELRDGIPAHVQLLHGSEYSGVSHWCPRGLAMHVCVAPSSRAQSVKLVLIVSNHDLASRRHFGVDGDFGIRHSQVWGVEMTGAGWNRTDPIKWKSTRDAVVGVKEWVMNSIYIPGF